MSERVELFQEGQAGELVGVKEHGVDKDGKRGQNFTADQDILDEEHDGGDEDGGTVKGDEAVEQGERGMKLGTLGILEQDVADGEGEVCDEDRRQSGESKGASGKEQDACKNGLNAEEGDEGGGFVQDETFEQDGGEGLSELPDEGGGGADGAVGGVGKGGAEEVGEGDEEEEGGDGWRGRWGWGVGGFGEGVKKERRVVGGREEGSEGHGGAEADEELDKGEVDEEVGLCFGVLQEGLGVDGIDVVGGPPE